MQSNRLSDDSTFDREFAGPLVAAIIGAAAGFFVGGWLAFDTGHWEEFRYVVDNTPLVSFLHIGIILFVVAVLLGTGVASVSASKSRR